MIESLPVCFLILLLPPISYLTDSFPFMAFGLAEYAIGLWVVFGQPLTLGVVSSTFVSSTFYLLYVFFISESAPFSFSSVILVLRNYFYRHPKWINH